MLVSLGLLAVAMAGPGAGKASPSSSSGAIVLVLDLSLSMQVAEGAETRLTRARRFLDRFVEVWAPLHPGTRMGLLGFADEAVTLCPLTSDVGAVPALLAQIEHRQDRLAPGTNLDRALSRACSMLPGHGGQILLVTDGEVLAGDVRATARDLGGRGIRLVIAGLGHPEPMPVPGSPDLFGRPRPHLGPDGRPAVSTANPGALVELARLSGGQYAAIQGPDNASAFVSRFPPEGGSSTPASRTWGLLPIATALVLLGVQAWRDPRFRQMVLVASCLLGQTGCTGFDPGMAREAERLHAGGQPAQAVERLGPSGAGRPAWWHHDRGCSLHALGRFEEAVREFELAARDPGGSPHVRAHRAYNLASSLIRSGAKASDPRPRWREAASTLERVLILEPTDDDARHNLEWLRRHLEDASASHGAPRQDKGDSAPSTEGEPSAGEDEIRSALEMLEREEKRFLESRERPDRGLDPWALDERVPTRPDW